METIKEFLESDIYLRIIKELGADNFYKKPESIEIELLRERLKQRQYLLEGFSYKPYSEKELVEFYKQTIDENRSFRYIAEIQLKNIPMVNFLVVKKLPRKKNQK